MPDYDIVQAFHEIESALIRSMMGNFKRHRAEETAQGYNWTQWQAEQLKYLNEYIRANQETFPERFDDVNEQIDQMLAIAAASGEADQEAEILKAIRQGYTPPHTPSQGLSGGFFSLNGRKLDALRKATQSDFSRAEYAVLRKANDAYRKIIFAAQVYANTGAGTYEKAVDMAARDFLRAGINSIVYKNGSTHTIEDYADMAIRTASKRAYLMGEGNRRAEWGIRKVVVNSRIGACPRCGQYVGKVFIDDVYSGGSKADGGEPLLSEAIRGGLFHPRCKDSTSTYFEGITTLKPMTEEEMEEMDRREKEEARQAYHEREAEKNQRIADNSLDPDNKKTYAHRAEQQRKKAEEIRHKLSDSSESSDIVSESVETAETTETVANSENRGIIYYGVREEVAAVFSEAFEEMVAKFGEISTISAVEPLIGGLASDYGSFGDHSGIIQIRFANKKSCLKELAQKAVECKKRGEWSSSHRFHVFRHEIGHAIQLEHAINDPLWNSKLKRIRLIMESSDAESMSNYGMNNIEEFVSECIAESMTKKARKTSKDVVNIILGVD